MRSLNRLESRTPEPSIATWFPTGLDEDKDGSINDVRVGSAADKAGLSPGQKITSINSMVFSPDRLIRAIQGATPVQLIVQDDEALTPVTLNDTEGSRYPRFTRVEGTPDRLTEILTRVTPAGP